MVLGVPYPLLWGLWVALVDFLPMIGGSRQESHDAVRFHAFPRPPAS